MAERIVMTNFHYSQDAASAADVIASSTASGRER
jgi:hypothetical protein